MQLTAKAIKRFHVVMMIVWVLLLIPSILWWRNSVLWVIILSIYANFGVHLSAYSGARAERRAEKQEESVGN